MNNFIKKYWIVILLLIGIGGIYSWYDPNYCYKEGKKYMDADFRDGLPNREILSNLANDYGLAREIGRGEFDENDMRQLKAEVNEFYNKYPHLKGGRVHGKGYIYDPNWDYATKFAQYFFHPNDIEKINIYLNKQSYPSVKPKKNVVGFYEAAFYNQCGKFTGSAMLGIGDGYILDGDEMDLKFNPYKTQKINKGQ